jgi:hypothetical protein
MKTDFLKREIQIGSRIVYPVRRGSAMWLSGPVRVIDITDEAIYAYADQGRNRVRLLHSDRCIVVQ